MGVLLHLPLPRRDRSRVQQNRCAWSAVVGTALADVAMLFAQSTIARPLGKMFTVGVFFVSMFAMIATFTVAVCLAHECNRYWPGVVVAISGFCPVYLLTTLVLIPGLFFRAASIFPYHFPAFILFATFVCLRLSHQPGPKSRKSLPVLATVLHIGGRSRRHSQRGRRAA